MRLAYYIGLSFLLLSQGCKKNKLSKIDNQLPSATQEGKNTVGFTIDGEVWLPYYQCGIGRNLCGEISARYDAPFAATNSLDFQFGRRRNDKLSYLNISGAFSTITSTGDKTDSIYVNYSAEGRVSNTGSYSGPMPGSKFIITKLDKENQIISGTFAFVLTEDNRSGKTITLKEGRFDFKFNACKCSN